MVLELGLGRVDTPAAVQRATPDQDGFNRSSHADGDLGHALGQVNTLVSSRPTAAEHRQPAAGWPIELALGVFDRRHSRAIKPLSTTSKTVRSALTMPRTRHSAAGVSLYCRQGNKK